MTKKVAIVSYLVYHSYNYRRFLRKRLKARINIGTFGYIDIKDGDFYLNPNSNNPNVRFTKIFHLIILL